MKCSEKTAEIRRNFPHHTHDTQTWHEFNDNSTSIYLWFAIGAVCFGRLASWPAKRPTESTRQATAKSTWKSATKTTNGNGRLMADLGQNQSSTVEKRLRFVLAIRQQLAVPSAGRLLLNVARTGNVWPATDPLHPLIGTPTTADEHRTMKTKAQMTKWSSFSILFCKLK